MALLAWPCPVLWMHWPILFLGSIWNSLQHQPLHPRLTQFMLDFIFHLGQDAMAHSQVKSKWVGGTDLVDLLRGKTNGTHKSVSPKASEDLLKGKANATNCICSKEQIVSSAVENSDNSNQCSRRVNLLQWQSTESAECKTKAKSNQWGAGQKILWDSGKVRFACSLLEAAETILLQLPPQHDCTKAKSN